MVRPANVPSPHITKLGSLKKKADGPKKISPKGSDAKITKKKKKQRKEKNTVVPEKKTNKAKKKRLKKVPREVVEQIRAMKNKGQKEPEVPPPSNESDELRIEVVTSAAVKRVATRVGIACISNEASKTLPSTPHHRAPPLSSPFQCIAVSAIKDYMTNATNACLMHARSSAHYISSTRTIHGPNLASAMETTNLGCLVSTA